jgi:zinc transport system substrate-binding protein
MKRALWLIVVVSIVVVLLLLSQQRDSRDISKKEHSVVTTIYPIYFITKSIVGDRVDIKRLIKPGSEIHSFSPTPKDMVDIDHSDLLITLGDKLEPWVSKISKATTVEILTLEDSLYLLHSDKRHHHHSEDDQKHHSKSGINPHVWLDFDNDIKMIEDIRDKLSQLYPDHSTIFAKNSSDLINSFKELDREYSRELGECQKDTILVGHDAFGYMQRRYHFGVESIMGVFAHSRPNASKIATLSKIIEHKRIGYLMIDPMESSKSALQLVKDMHLDTMSLYTLGNIPLESERKGSDMMTLLRSNLSNLKKALKCQ